MKPFPKFTPLRLVLLVIASAVLASCATHSSVSNHFLDEESQDPLQKILIVTTGEDRSLGRQFERVLSYRIVQHDGVAVSMSEIIGIENLPLKEDLIRVARERGADGILVTRLKSVSA